MNEFDVIIGMDAATLNKAIARLYNRGDLRGSLFRGSRTQNIEGTDFAVQWDIQAAPETILAPPTAQEWQSSFKADGNMAQPVSNAFFLNFSKIRLVQTAPDKNEATIPARAICTASVSGNQLNIQVIAVIIDLSGASKTDQFIYKRIIIPEILHLATSLLSGITMPPLSFYKIALTPPVVSIQSNRLILFANLADRPLASISGGNWPDKPFFILCSSRLAQRIGDIAAGTVRGKTFSYRGKINFEIGDASYSASGSINQVVTSVTGDLTVMNCRLGANARVSADLSLNPFKPIKKIFTPWD